MLKFTVFCSSLAGMAGHAVIIDGNSNTPSVTETTAVGDNRYWSSLAVLADGQVLMTGGGGTANGQHINEAYNPALSALIWNPATSKWTTGSSAKKSREYHSTNLLLPDATVLVAGGDAPGPIAQLNAEIYYPPYLFNKDGSKTLATRPVIQYAPDRLDLGKNYNFSVENNTTISRITLVKTGSVTHSMNMDQRFFEVPFKATGANIQININESSNVLTPGYYMLFAFDNNGTPSVAKIISIPPSTNNAAPSFSLMDSFDSFSGTNKIGLNGNATVIGKALTLTNNTQWQSGSAFYRAPVSLNNNSSLYSEFQFRIGGGSGGDGMTFTLQGNNSFQLGNNGGGLGYEGVQRSIAIEIDTYANNTNPNENSNSHISILSNGSVNAPLATYHAPFKLNDNKSHKMWVEYNSFEKKLNVYLSENPLATKPTKPTLSINIDLSATVGSSMYLGFTAGTGGNSDQHSIENWTWRVGSSPTKGSDTLLINQRLFTNQYVQSANKKYQAIMQNDGNFVLYSGNRALWASNTMNSGTIETIMQSDGNLVGYTPKQRPTWASNTMNSGANRMIMQDDGNLVLYRSDNKPVWASNTVQHP